MGRDDKEQVSSDAYRVSVLQLLDLLLPPSCPGCGAEGELLCPPCRLPLTRRFDEPPGVPVGLPATMPDGVVQLEWCAAFTGSVRAALHSLKYEGIRRLAEPLGDALAERWRRAGVGGEILVPVPLHPDKRRERGYNQAYLLAAACARSLGLPVFEALGRREATEAQHLLDRRARARNVGEAFSMLGGLERAVGGRWVVLVDDVVTTGATVAACAAALDAAGALAVSALAVARER